MLGENFATTLAGTSRDFAESSSSLLYAFIFTLVLIYLVLAAQFESYRDPLIVMFTVPLAIAGAVLSLYLFNQTLNIFSEIGIIVLIGIVTKNGILIVEFANQKKDLGLSLNEAVLEGATLRLRPILMTSLATGLGALPIALAIGAAAKSTLTGCVPMVTVRSSCSRKMRINRQHQTISSLRSCSRSLLAGSSTCTVLSATTFGSPGALIVWWSRN